MIRQIFITKNNTSKDLHNNSYEVNYNGFIYTSSPL